MRRWEETLFQASFRGVPFYVEADDERTGRRLVVHEFPRRDEPFVEDMGRKARTFEVTAYLCGDDADAQSAALIAAAGREGAGVLVLPAIGPILVQCHEAARRRERDRAGYFAVSLQVVRDGAATPLASVLSLANLVFIAAGAIGSVLSAWVGARTTTGIAEAIGNETVAGLTDAVSEVEVLRSSLPVDATASAPLARAIESLFADAALARLPAQAGPVAASVVTLAREVVDAVEPAAAVRFLRAELDSFTVEPVPAASSNATIAERVAVNRAATAAVTRVALVTAFVEAQVRRTFPSRREAIDARADIAELLSREQEAMSGADDAPLYLAIEDIKGRGIDYLSRQIADLAPVVTIEAAQSMPSLWWAYRLYGDPARATELVARNAVRHPSFIPQTFEALAR